MTKAEFIYNAPTSIAEAVSLLSSGAQLQPLSGGYAVVREISRAGSMSGGLVDLRKIPNLDLMSEQQDGQMRIGAMVTLGRIAADPAIKARWTALSDAASLVGDEQTRAHATLGGSIALRASGGTAASSGPNDIHAALLALDARVEVTSASVGVSDVHICEILQDGLAQGSLITAVLIPALGASAASAYVKMRHPASLYPICGVAAVVGVAKTQQIKSLALAVTGATSGTVRMAELETALIGRTMPQALPLSGVSLEHCASDSFAAADYRQHLAGVLTQDAVASALSRLQ